MLSDTKRISRMVRWGVAIGALVFASAACGPQKYVVFQVWEGAGQTSEAKKKFIGGVGGYHDEVWALLEKNDVDGAIQRIEADENKNYFDFYNLAILYEAKSDWGNAEANIQAAIRDHDETFKKPDSKYEAELAYILDHKAKYLGTPAQ